MTPQDVMNAQEIANLLHVKPQTLYDHRWREQSGCPLFKQGRKLFAYRVEFDTWYRKRLIYV